MNSLENNRLREHRKFFHIQSLVKNKANFVPKPQRRINESMHVYIVFKRAPHIKSFLNNNLVLMTCNVLEIFYISRKSGYFILRSFFIKFGKRTI